MAPPLLPHLLNSPPLNHQVHTQWTNPSDILSLLLLVGGDVIQRAIAQQAGQRHWPTPVPFSFGWVAYAFTGLLAAVGDTLLMPPAPDLPSVVISTASGYPRTNQSWILGRILRDFELAWMTPEAREGLAVLLRRKRTPKASLCVSVWEPDVSAPPKCPRRDWVWWSGYGVVATQVALAAVAWARFGAWEVLAITVGGEVLAVGTASLPQWRRERWPCRERTRKSFIICRGNGCQHALVVYGNGAGLDLEDLASTGEGTTTRAWTRGAMAVLAAGWVVLLITVSGIRDQTWFLVGIGTLGMMHTVFVAGKARAASAFGVPLTPREYFLGEKVMDSLRAVETEYPGVGIAFLATFFPGDLKNQEEIDYWDERRATKKERYEEREASRKAAATEKLTL